jgi:hypothetical protein
MTKKFREYIKDKSAYVSSVLSIEEIDDQFLRLKEIYNCRVKAYLQKSPALSNYYLIYVDFEKEGSLSPEEVKDHFLNFVSPTSKQYDKSKDQLEEEKSNIEEEIMCIKRRIERMFPVTMKFMVSANFKDLKHDLKDIIVVPKEYWHENSQSFMKYFAINYTIIISLK